MKKKGWILLLAFLVIIIMALSFTDLIDSNFGMSLALELFVFFDIIIALVAHKNGVKVVKNLMIVLACIGILLFSVNIIIHGKIKLKDGLNFQIIAIPNKSEKELLFRHNNINYYTYNLSDLNINVRKNQEKMSLESAITSGVVTLDEILSMMIPNSDTVGYKIYYDGGTNEFDYDEYSIIICENSDVIFSTYEYKYDPSICTN